MSFSIAVKERIARVVAEHFSTSEIVSVFTDANTPTNESLFAKWRIVLDAFSKMTDQEQGIPYIIEAFCHPLNFQDQQVREKLIKELNAILSYEDLEIKATDRTSKVCFNGKPIDSSVNVAHFKTPIDYVTEALSFFKNEYNKVRISGLSYEYSLGENSNSHVIENGREEYDEKLKAIKQLKDVGFITEYKIEPKAEGKNDYIDYVWDYAVCKIDDSKITQKEAPRATDAGVQNLTQKIIHEHTHHFENSIQEKDIDLNHKVEIVKIPELQIKNVEENTLKKGKKRIRLPKFNQTDWAKVTIRFLDERNVLITADKKELVPADFETLGFADDKRDKPNLAWTFFLGLAQNNGETKPLATPIPDSIKQQKKYLSDCLKTIFKNDTDPFYYSTETHIYKIKINLISPQLESRDKDEYGIQEHIKEIMTGVYEEKYENEE